MGDPQLATAWPPQGAKKLVNRAYQRNPPQGSNAAGGGGGPGTPTNFQVRVAGVPTLFDVRVATVSTQIEVRV